MKRIAWCTPFSAASSISEFSHSIVEAYNLLPSNERSHKVDVLVNTNGKRYPSSSSTFDISHVLQHSEQVAMFSESYDHVIYNLGNNKENHGAIFELSKRVPGVAILHDYVYQHYFAGEIFDVRKAPKAYAFLMGRHYGDIALRNVAASQIMSKNQPRIGLWDTDVASKFPLLHAIVSESRHKGIVVHSELAKRAVQECYSGPILQLRLAGDEKQQPTRQDIDAWKNNTASKDRVTVAIIGHIQRGKQIHHVIDILLNYQSHLPKIGKLIIAGKPSDREYTNSLIEMIRARGAGALIQLETDVSHDRLQQIKADADFYINIRYPNTEGGSGSLIEQMASSKPVIILDSGIFSEMTRGVIKIASLTDEVGLVSALKRLSENPTERIRIGSEARAYTDEFGSADYAKKIFEFCDGIGQAKTRSKKNGYLETNDIFEFDAEVRSPEPLLAWDDESFIEFGKLLLTQYFDEGLVPHLKQLAAASPLRAFRAYSVARSVMTVLDEHARGEVPRLWLINYDPVDEEIMVISALKGRHFSTLISLMASSDQNREGRCERALSRFSLGSTVGKIAVAWAIGIGRQTDHTLSSLGEGLATFAPVLKRLVDASDQEFASVMISKWRTAFDRVDYVRRHADLADNLSNGGDQALRHFEKYGQHEGRTGRLIVDLMLENFVK